MRVLDVLNSPWAIEKSKLTEIRSIYDAHAKSEKVDLDALSARLGRQLGSDSQGYTVNNGVAIVPIHGVMAKKMNMFAEISGGASTELIARDIKDAVSDESVNAIMLHIDSPGGTVDGIESLTNVIREAGNSKPIVSFVDGLMASAAYWAGSASHEVVASSNTAAIGSIGVVATHTDMSKAEESAGVKVTEISAGKYKRIASSHEPLSDDGRAEIQAQVDQIYSIFVDTVAENRGSDVDTVLEKMADGRVFLAKQAMKRGLIDRIASFEEVINDLSSEGSSMTTKKDVKQDVSVDAEAVTLEAVKRDYPDIALALISEGAEAERERIKACEGASFPGHEKLVNAMKYDGTSQASDVALAVMNAEKEVRAKHNADYHANAPQVVPFAGIDPVKAEDSMTDEEKLQAKWDSDANLRADFPGGFESYKKFIDAQALGKVKIIGGAK